MKKFLSLLMLIAGAAATVWGGYHAFSGNPNTAVPFTNDYKVSTMLVGLVGLGFFTIGLIGQRD